jgi:hypothetical protein
VVFPEIFPKTEIPPIPDHPPPNSILVNLFSCDGPTLLQFFDFLSALDLTGRRNKSQEKN